MQTASLLNIFLEEAGFFSGCMSSNSEEPNCDNDRKKSLDSSLTNSDGTKECSTSSIISYHVGGLLLRHICQLICNGHAIREKLFVAESDSVDVVEEQRIATAIYPTTSLLNHSCKPNVIAR